MIRKKKYKILATVWKGQNIQEWTYGELLEGNSGDGEKELRNVEEIKLIGLNEKWRCRRRKYQAYF